MVTCGKTPATVTWSECLRVYYHVIVRQQRRRVEQSLQVLQSICRQRSADMSEQQSYHCMFKQIKQICTAVHGHHHLSLKCRLLNRTSFEVFDQWFCKVETRACERLRSFWGLAVTILPGALRLFKVVSILPLKCWWQQIRWRYCAASQTFGLVAWRNTKKKVTLSRKCCPVHGVTVRCFGCYANLQFHSHLADFHFFFFAFVQAFFQALLSCYL